MARLMWLLAAGACLAVVGTATSAERKPTIPHIKPFAHGKLTRTVNDVRFSLTIPKTGWENGPHEKIGNRFRTHGLLISKSTRGGQAAEEVIFWAGARGNREVTPCAEVLTSAAGLSRADLAAAIARAPGTRPGGGPHDTTVGGHSATYLALRVKQDVGCQPGLLFTWPHSECWGACWLRTEVGDSVALWIVDVGTKRLFLVAITKPGAGEWQEIGDIKRSIRIS